jgi:hypothetical protein
MKVKRQPAAGLKGVEPGKLIISVGVIHLYIKAVYLVKQNRTAVLLPG